MREVPRKIGRFATREMEQLSRDAHSTDGAYLESPRHGSYAAKDEPPFRIVQRKDMNPNEGDPDATLDSTIDGRAGVYFQTWDAANKKWSTILKLDANGRLHLSGSISNTRREIFDKNDDHPQ